jgi:hypothetical protein
LYYLDRAVLEANLGPLRELYETRKADAEKKGIVRKIAFEELEVIGLLGTGQYFAAVDLYSVITLDANFLRFNHLSCL